MSLEPMQQSTAGSVQRAASEPSLEPMKRRYSAYRRGQVLYFISSIPKSGVRPLYRRARDWAVATGVHEDKDPYRSLTLFVEHSLPLPPFDAWLTDFYANPLEHLDGMDEAPSPIGAEPVPVESRPTTLGETDWTAELYLFRDGDEWRGYVLFREDNGAGEHRTADIFLDDNPRLVRDRFLSFEPGTLQGFLRSTLS